MDPRGKHALKCEVGVTRVARQYGLRDFTAEFHPKVTGYAAVKEQRVAAWDCVNPRSGLLEEARLDVATRDSTTNRKIFVDTMVTCASRVSRPVPAGMEWAAAWDAVRGKRRKGGWEAEAQGGRERGKRAGRQAAQRARPGSTNPKD